MFYNQKQNNVFAGGINVGVVYKELLYKPQGTENYVVRSNNVFYPA